MQHAIWVNCKHDVSFVMDASFYSPWFIAMNDRIHILQRQPKRISVTLSYRVHELLLTRSEEEGRSVSNLCAYLLEESLDKHKNEPTENMMNGSYQLPAKSTNHFNSQYKT